MIDSQTAYVTDAPADDERVTLELCICGQHFECPDGWHYAPESDDPHGAWCGCTPDCALDSTDEG